MQLEAKVEAAQFMAAFNEYRQLVKVMPSKALTFQGRKLFELVAKNTPPRNLSQGRKAVKRDVERAVQPIKPDTFRNPEVQKMVRQRDYAGLHEFAQRASGGRWDIVPFEEKLHKERRDKRGRVRKGSGLLTPDTDKVREYISKLQSHVGMGRGGWAASILSLGGTIAKLAERWASRGSVVNKVADPISAYIQGDNKSPWAGQGDEDRVIANSMAARAGAINADIERRLEQAKQKAGLA